MTPAPGLGWSRDKNTVTLRMTLEDWQDLIYLLGLASGSLDDDSREAAAHALANRINAGNPNWRPVPYPVVHREAAP